MTRSQRRLYRTTAIVGIVTTLLTVLLDQTGLLQSVQLYLSDFRALHYQHFAPAPTEKLVHLDIDDASIDAIGDWPWPRDKWASIIDEINLAGTKNVAMDVIFPDQDSQSGTPGDGKDTPNDLAFADALNRFKSTPGRGVLLPMDIDINRSQDHSPLWAAMVREYQLAPELNEEQMASVLHDRGFKENDLVSQVYQLVNSALAEAMFVRIRTAIDQGTAPTPAAMRASILPRSVETGERSHAVQVLERVLPHLLSFESMQAFTLPNKPAYGPLLSEDTGTLPIPPLAKSAANSGFVNLWQTDDGKVRTMPLFLLSRGRLVPQMGLSMACQALDIQLSDLALSRDRLTIPLKNHTSIDIPLYSRPTRTSGSVGMLMDIPWLGTADWRTIYDFPAHTRPFTQHLSLIKIWEICAMAQQIQTNDAKALDDIAALGSPEDAAAIRKNHPLFSDADAWSKLMADTLDNQPPGTMDDLAPYIADAKLIDAQTSAKDREKLTALRNLVLRPRTNTALLQQRERLRAALHKTLADKTALIGWLATGTVDFRPTPLHDECPGVIVHGAIFSAILSGFTLTHAANYWGILLTLAAGLLSTEASARLGVWRALVAAGVIFLVAAVTNFSILYDFQKIEVAPAAPLVACVLVYASCTLTHFLFEQMEKRAITNRFRSYVDPRLVNYVLKHWEDSVFFTGDERELTVVFTDLQGFTQISERLKSETVGLLNDYFSRMEPIIRDNDGLMNKFLGDGMMFFFGAPEPFAPDADRHALAAVKTVMEMQAAMFGFNRELLERGLPTLRMRAGVSTGRMVVGDAGTPTRSDYTVLGDRVNFASRLESANKATGTLILLSDRTVELIHGAYLVRPVGKLQVVGKKEAVMTYEPLAETSKCTEAMQKIVALSAEITTHYQAADFAKCLQAVEALSATTGSDQKPFCDLYRHLCNEFLTHPPQDFAGEIRLEHK